jgi:hypothetical protein
MKDWVNEGKGDIFVYALSILLLSGEKLRPRQSTGGPLNKDVKKGFKFNRVFSLEKGKL